MKRRVIKYKKQYLITVEGKTETRSDLTDEMPFPLAQVEMMLNIIVQSCDDYYKSRNVTIEEVDNG